MKSKFYRILLYILPAVLYFSYYPVISFGSSESMHFELSLPLIWLVVFDITALVLLIKKELFVEVFKKWQFLLFPIFATLTLIWSANRVRGFLTVGVLWLLYFAAISFYLLRGEVKEKKFWRNLWRLFIGSSLVVAAWCLIQCILDVIGVPRECSLMCVGCTSSSFGFPHPNGFAIEPQFMGNLLLAPTIMCGVQMFKNRKMLLLFFIFSCAVFLTFSRGAIYALIVAMIFFTAMKVVQTKKWREMLVWPVIILAFLFTLNLQGIFAAVSPTNDTYFSGIAKALNHLSLGIIDIRAKDSSNVGAVSEESNGSTFDGYVEDSTNIRMQLTGAALKTWAKDPQTILFGVGIGGAGQAMYDAGNSDWPKEIVQNEYASLLLETGIIGIVLIIYTAVLVLKALKKSANLEMNLTLIFGYGITLLFFAGLPNALHIYIIPAVLPYGKS